MIITDITKHDKRVEVRMVDEGTAYIVELTPYKIEDVPELFSELKEGLPWTALPLGGEAEEDPQGLSDKDIREYLEYYAD